MTKYYYLNEKREIVKKELATQFEFVDTGVRTYGYVGDVANRRGQDNKDNEALGISRNRRQAGKHTQEGI